ncbi:MULTISPECIES: NAD(P)/FAD-dependent oxidoreductase [Marinobacter]|nr:MULTISPECIES: FAD-dependent oxidoreductase [Marinobacter]
MTPNRRRTLVICGHGMVAQRLLEELVAQPAQPYQRIVVFNGEAAAAYNRIQLSALLAGETAEDTLSLKTPDWFRRHHIEVHQSEPVVAIDRQQRSVITATGRVQCYDTLVLATGSRAASPGLPGEDLDGVMSFRHLQDTRNLIAASATRRRAVVIGGGFLGLEAAEGLRCRGMDVTVLQRSSHLLNQQLDPAGGQLLAAALARRGLHIMTGARPVRILGKQQVRAVQLADDTLISTDLVVLATGITANLELAAAAGLRCDRAICVDPQLRTSDPDIHALGECCQLGGATFGLVEPGYQQARVLARLLSASAPRDRYQPSPVATRLKISGIAIFSCGQPTPDDTTESLLWQDRETGGYCHLLVRDHRLRGAVLIGNTRDGPWYQQRIAQGDDISRYRAQLPFGEHYCLAAA